MIGGAPRRGKVTSFDAERGLGSLTAEDGGDFPFHCTAITDGSRRIDEGTSVSFVVAPGHLGRYEARVVTPLR